MTSCLVTGGAGFIGSHVVDRLVELGHPVRVLHNFSSRKTDNLRHFQGRVEVIHGSITDPRAVRDAVRDVEWVFHLAALPSVQRSVEDPLASHEACATGTLNVLDAARHAGVRRVVYAGSSSGYGGTPGT